MSNSTNITRIKAVNNALGILKDKVVFVGGATVSLYPDRSFLLTKPFGLLKSGWLNYLLWKVIPSPTTSKRYSKQGN